MFGNSIAILYSALLSEEKALEIRNRNVANVNNPDYVREEPVLNNLADFGGVVFSDVRRVSDEILQNQLLRSNTKYKGLEEEKQFLESVSVYFDETLTENVQGFINKFFQSLHDFLREPDNEAAKVALLEKANDLVKILQDRYQRLEDIENATLDKVEPVLNRVNTLSKELAKLNKEIAFSYAKNKGQGNDYKNLLDQRDKLLRELSELVNVDFKFDKIGRVEVNIKEQDSTASGFINLVNQTGEANSLVFDRANLKVIDQNGIAWPFNFFKSGILGAYANSVKVVENLKGYLDKLAETLEQNVKLEDNNLAVFEISDTNFKTETLSVKITKSDLDNYDQTKAETDTQNIDDAWKTVNDAYKDLTSYLSNTMSDTKIKYETERDLLDRLKEKYSEKTGVNLDEELVEIMKLQQHYQAVSKMVATSTRLIDYILNSVK